MIKKTALATLTLITNTLFAFQISHVEIDANKTFNESFDFLLPDLTIRLPNSDLKMVYGYKPIPPYIFEFKNNQAIMVRELSNNDQEISIFNEISGEEITNYQNLMNKLLDEDFYKNSEQQEQLNMYSNSLFGIYPENPDQKIYIYRNDKITAYYIGLNQQDNTYNTLILTKDRRNQEEVAYKIESYLPNSFNIQLINGLEKSEKY